MKIAPLQRGDYVRLRIPATNSTVRGMVTLASENGRAVIVMFSGALRTESGGMLLSMAPLFIDYDAETVLLLPVGERIEVDVADAKP